MVSLSEFGILAPKKTVLKNENAAELLRRLTMSMLPFQRLGLLFFIR